MTRFERCLVSTLILLGAGGCGKSQQPQTQVKELPNGIRVAVVHFPASTNVSIFTFTPMGLAGDGHDHAQWAHLVEHLVIRTTVPGDLMHANAETLADHMRLDTYGTVTDWKDWLGHHRRWIEGIPFTETRLKIEKPRVVAECDRTAKNLATHKFAMAAWAHGMRHGKTLVALKGDVLRADLADLQALRDKYFAVPGQVTVCVVGGVEAATALAAVEEKLGNLKLTGTPIPKVKGRSGHLDLTWDLEARHLLLTWPIPDFGNEDYAALMVAGQLLNIQFASAPQLKQQTGMVFCGADLITPEGNFFYISASLRPGANAEDVRKRLLDTLDRLATSKAPNQAAAFGKQFAFSLTQVADPTAMKSSLPVGVTSAMIEGNIGLMFGLNVQRYGTKRETLAQNLAAITPGKVQNAMQTWLSDGKCSACTIRGGQ